MFNNNDQQQQRPAPRRHQPLPQQQYQYHFGLGEQNSNNYLQQQQQQQHYDEYHHQYPHPQGDRMPAQQKAYPNQHVRDTNLSGDLSWMTINRTVNISRSNGASGGGGILPPPPPPPGLGKEIEMAGTSMSLPDPPTISSTFARGPGGANPWSGGGGGGGGAFGAPPSTSSGLHSGGPYRGPTPPTPGSGWGQPRYQQDQKDYGGGNVFAPPFYLSPQPVEGPSPPRRIWQDHGPVPSSFKPAPPTSLAGQSSGNVVEVQEVPSAYHQSPSFDFGGEEDVLPPYSSCPHPQQQGYQYHSQHQQQVGPMGSIGEYSSNHHLQHLPSSPQRSHSRSSSRSYHSSAAPSPSRSGRGRGRGGGGRGWGGDGRGRVGGGRGGSRPSSRNSSHGSSNRDRPSSVASGQRTPDRPRSVIGAPSPTLSELEVFSSPGRQQMTDSAASNRSPRTPRPDSAASHGSNSSGGSRRSGGRRSGGRPRSRSDSRNSSDSPNPQNLRGDPFRKSKIKTELCRNYMKDGTCQYADKCNYAHGKDDLKFQTLLELDNGGVTDVEIYRTRACFTWVATGSCPFEQRCGGLHDPRVIGPKKHWLPHAEMNHNSVLAGRNVDKNHHQRLSSIYNCSPLYGYAPAARWKEGRVETSAAWKHFYSYVCNISPHPMPETQEPTELCQVFMAIKMREGRGGQIYSYMPSHLLYQTELCMVLQRKAFAVPKRGAVTTKDILDITGDETYNSDPRKIEKYNVHSAHLIAFGPVGDPESRSLSVWYDLKTVDLKECTPQESKRYKRSRHLIKPGGDKEEGRIPMMENISTESYRQEQSVIALRLSINENRRDHDDHPHFYNYQPADNDTFDFVTDILKHRLHYLDSRVVLPQDSGSRTRNDLQIQKEEEDLIARFESLRRHWVTWSWPVRSGVQEIDKDTPIPDTNGEYYFGLQDRTNFQVEIFFGVDKDPSKPDVVTKPMTKAAVAFLWESFLINCRLAVGKSPKLRFLTSEAESRESFLSARTLASVNRKFTSLRRLPVFRLLSLDMRVSDYNEIMELPMMSPRRRTPSPEVLELLLLSSRRTPSPQLIPDIMETLFEEWDDLIAYMENKNQEDSEEQNEAEEAKEEEKAGEEARTFASPVGINDDNIIHYLNQAAAKETRSSA